MATIAIPPIVDSPSASGINSLPINTDFISSPKPVLFEINQDAPSASGINSLPINTDFISSPKPVIFEINQGASSATVLNSVEVGGGVTSAGAGTTFDTINDSILYDAERAATDYSSGNFPALIDSDGDWRMRISLAPNANYLYKAANNSDHILYPLAQTNGVIFPYTPQVSVSYTANYNSQDLTHSNFKLHQYSGSEVGAVTITADFTAQDTMEANYLLAVIHFFKSMTKMFYGTGSNIGLPPPLCYIEGFGSAQFDRHPMVINSFNYQMPNDVDYIRASTKDTSIGFNLGSSFKSGTEISSNPKNNRLSAAGLTSGAGVKMPKFSTKLSSSEATYVPTKISLTIQCLPVVSRNDMSKNFSLEKYAAGRLKGSYGGIW